jgi:hypothetical protein
MAATKVKTLAEQKRDLIARGDLYRRAMADDLRQIEGSLGWIPKTMYLIKATSPLLVLGSPLIAWLLRGRRKTKIAKNGEPQKGKASILGRIWAAIRIAQQTAPFVHGFMQAWPKAKKSQPRASESVHSGHRARP